MSQTLLERFCTAWVLARGGVAEPGPEGLRCLLETPVARILGCAEEPVLTFQADRPGVYAGLGSEVLEAAATDTLATIPVGFGRFEGVSLRGKNLEADLKRDFTFQRCFPSDIDPVASREPVTRIWFRLSMVSDEVRELLLPFSIFEAHGRLLEPDEEPAPEWDLLPLPADDLESGGFKPLEALLRELEPAVRARATAEVTRFQAVQKHRLGLDLRRVTEYFGGLYDGIGRRQGSGLSASEAREKEQALVGDFRRQVEDVRQKASIRARIRPVAVLRLLMPVLLARVAMKVGSFRREARLIWSPVRRKFEPFRCPCCGSLGTHIEGTRDGAILCPSCAAVS